MTKNEQRKQLKALLANLAERNEKSDRIACSVLSMNEYKNAKSIFVYLSTKNEVSTEHIVADAMKSGKIVCVPTVNGDTMSPVKICADTEYILDSFGIRTPKNGIPYCEDVELSIVPLLGFDDEKHRLGRGKGYYDKYLDGKKTIKIALAFSCQKLGKIIINENDIAMDYIVTEDEICE